MFSSIKKEKNVKLEIYNRLMKIKFCGMNANKTIFGLEELKTGKFSR